MHDSLTDRVFDVVEGLETFAAERDLRLLDVAIGGLAAKPAVASVIAGATSAQQVAANVAAGSWRPTAEDLRTLDEITAPPQ
jgi:aryl-alcohol dehydrogenase-like predicted oxidoreductase